MNKGVGCCGTILICFLVFLPIIIPACVSSQMESAARRAETEAYLQERREREYERTHPYSYVIDDPETPYVGMPESMIDKTGLGKHDHYYEYKNFNLEVHHYSWKRKGSVYFGVTVEYGVVSEADDYR